MFNSVIGATITGQGFFISLLTAMVLGILSALVQGRFNRNTASLSMSLVLLPPIVTLVIMMVNGNIGAGLAVAGTFALVRFRSLPGTAREVSSIFMSVAIGLACGMGYVAVAAMFFVMMALLIVALELSGFGKGRLSEQQLKITVPENLDYEELFEDVLAEYTVSHELIRVRTVNMGTLYELTYEVLLRKSGKSRDFIDALRCRNGNLSVSLGRAADKESM